MAKLKRIESKEDSLWEDVNSLIQQKKTKAYGEAIVNLKSLKELAVHKGRYAAFQEKVELIRQENRRLNGLTSSIDSAKLILTLLLSTKEVYEE